MRLSKIATVQSGYISRAKIRPSSEGSHLLLQAKDVDGHRLAYGTDDLMRFEPVLSGKDWILRGGDLLFMARGARNYSVLLDEIPDSVLAAACFFIVRVSTDEVLPEYLFWYLNQAPVERYLSRHSGRGVHMPVVRRAVLESLDVPTPPLETQKKIANLDALMRKEQSLLDKLSEKRKKLISTACLKTVRESR
ncbi:MAG: restriction endonuclease subunit S [Thermodesulfobacteriota bacterium]|nr:restriction endonuclease subunit S [Thermodesulfobacteriota bacterium]